MIQRPPADPRRRPGPARSKDESVRRRYRALVRLWPRWYRDAYGEEMEEAFLTLLRMDRERSGWLGTVRCWMGAVADALLGGLSMRARRSPGGRFETARGLGGGEVMGSMISDVRFAVRALVRRPVFALTAVSTIAIGIGANASVFTVVNGFMIKPLPYADEHELIALHAGNPALGWSGTDVNPANAWDWRERSTTLADLTVYNRNSHNLTGGDQPELVSGMRVTPNFLSVLGHQPAIGRDFRSDEFGEGRDAVAIISDGFWARRFARDRSVLGSTLVLDGKPVVVVGVLAPSFTLHEGVVDLYRPWGVDFAAIPRDDHGANAIGRLREGVTLAMARDDLETIASQLAAEHPENEGWTVEVSTLRSEIVGPVAANASIVLMAAVGFILLMACVNVANLLLVRAGARTREIAVRVSLGAGRRRVARQLLTESAVIAGVGGSLGLVAALWGSRAIVAALPPTMPPVFEFGMDRNVLLFTIAITVGAALVFGLVPAVSATSDQGDALRAGSRSGRSRASRRFGGVLVVTQTAMAVVLLVGGGLLMKSVTGMRSQDLGFQPENVITARITPPPSQYATAAELSSYWRDVIERVREVPGVVEAGTTQSHPLYGSNWGRTVRVEGQGMPTDQGRRARLTVASPGLFEALRFGMAQGRVFTTADGPDAPPVVIVNEAFVERYLAPTDDPLAQTIVSEGWSGTVVGVVHDVIERGIDSPPEPSIYVPMGQSVVRGRSLVVRASGDPTGLVEAIQDAVWSVDSDVPLARIQTMDDLIDDRVGGFAVIGYVMGAFALLSLLLGAVGIYGVTAFAAGQRTGEIGVRLALGARRGDVVSMVVREGARRAVLGLALGLGLALATGSAMAGILVGVSPRDPLTFVGVTAVLGAVSWFGLWIPARRASNVDPVEALIAD
jgi:putative ABC transport system permease protein